MQLYYCVAAIKGATIRDPKYGVHDPKYGVVYLAASFASLAPKGTAKVRAWWILKKRSTLSMAWYISGDDSIPAPKKNPKVMTCGSLGRRTTISIAWCISK